MVRHEDISLIERERGLSVIHGELLFYNCLFTRPRLHSTHTCICMTADIHMHDIGALVMDSQCQRCVSVLHWRWWINKKWVDWLVGRLTSPFSIKTVHIRDKVLGGDLVPPG